MLSWTPQGVPFSRLPSSRMVCRAIRLCSNVPPDIANTSPWNTISAHRRIALAAEVLLRRASAVGLRQGHCASDSTEMPDIPHSWANAGVARRSYPQAVQNPRPPPAVRRDETGKESATDGAQMNTDDSEANSQPAFNRSTLGVHRCPIRGWISSPWCSRRSPTGTAADLRIRTGIWKPPTVDVTPPYRLSRRRRTARLYPPGTTYRFGLGGGAASSTSAAGRRWEAPSRPACRRPPGCGTRGEGSSARGVRRLFACQIPLPRRRAVAASRRHRQCVSPCAESRLATAMLPAEPSGCRAPPPSKTPRGTPLSLVCACNTHPHATSPPTTERRAGLAIPSAFPFSPTSPRRP